MKFKPTILSEMTVKAVPLSFNFLFGEFTNNLKTIIMLTIINSIFILYLLIKGNRTYYFTFEKEKTFYKKTLSGYLITLWRKETYGANGVYTLHIPIKNRRKIELKEEVERLIKDRTNTPYTLRAKFSWLKSWEEVKQFKKDYSIVDAEIVNELISKFATKTNKIE